MPSYTRQDLNQAGVRIEELRMALGKRLDELAAELRRGGLTRIGNSAAKDCAPVARELAATLNEIDVIAEHLWSAPHKPVLAYERKEVA